MRVLADALRLPLRSASVDTIISNPPYPGNGVWADDYSAGLQGALAECKRVLRPGRRGWFLLRRVSGAEQWLCFDRTGERWGPPGRSDVTYRPWVSWGTVPEYDLLPLILQQSEPGDVVLDPFAGSDAIPALAARLGRTPLSADIRRN